MTAIDTTDLEARIGDLAPSDFERFCQVLVEAEAYSRHKEPRVEGPAGASVADEGRDILLVCSRAPEMNKLAFQTRYRVHPLTEDPPASSGKVRVVYSCKTGKDWLDLGLRDAKKQTGRCLEVLKEGGYFKLLVGQIARLDENRKRDRPDKNAVDAPPIDHLVAWLESATGLPNLAHRVEILDANDLARFVRNVDADDRILQQWGAKLRIREKLLGLEEWSAVHREERDDPKFEPDDSRTHIQDAIGGWLANGAASPLDAVGWLVGAPGVGKTRLVLETLRAERFADRVRAAVSPSEAERALDDGLLARRPNCIIVVDDCPPGELASLAARFRALRAMGARLLVLTPMAPRYAQTQDKIAHRWDLDAMDEASLRRLVATELGQSDTDEPVAAIGRLAEGYPWFAVLLAKETLQYGRAPSSMKEAVDWALVSKSEASGDALAASQLLRARTLLAAMLAWDTDWDVELDEEGRAELARAVQADSWRVIRDDADRAKERGLLRLRAGWKYKYVTPAILEREIVRRLLAPPPDGTDPGGRALQGHGAAYAPSFLSRLERLGLSRELLTSIARATLAALIAVPPGWDALASSAVRGATLLFVAERLPDDVARVLRDRVLATPLEELAQRVDIRRDLVFALDSTVGTPAAFELAEETLFELAKAENESYVNSASGVWASLFLLELNATYRSVAQRMTLLARRCRDKDAAGRRVALLAIQAMFGTRIVRERRPIDGPWPRPTPEEARGARALAIELLAERFEDSNTEIATKAKGLSIRELRDFVRAGLGAEALSVLRERLAAFTEAELGALSEALSMVHEYDASFLDAAAAVALEGLTSALIPEGFSARLHRSLGAWGPATLRETSNDVPLATDGLTGERLPIADEIDWLLSDAAVRARSFASTLGSVDAQMRFFELLRGRLPAPRAVSLLATYLAARNERDPAAVATALASLRSAAFATVFVSCVMTVGASNDACRWLADALRQGLWRPADCRGFPARGWLRAVSDENAGELFRAFLEQGDEGAAIVLEALSDRLDGRKLAPFESVAARGVMVGATLDLGGLVEHHWARVATALLSEGRTADVAQAAIRAIAGRTAALHEAWRVLALAASNDAEAAWPALAAVLEARSPETGHLLLAFRFHRGSIDLPTSTVLAWVGNDEQRARAVVELIRPQTAKLNPILRELIIRFGAGSSVANGITARLHSTERAVSSLAGHDAAVLGLVSGWTVDADPAIKAFAERAVASLKQSWEEHAAYEEHERRRFGT